MASGAQHRIPRVQSLKRELPPRIIRKSDSATFAASTRRSPNAVNVLADIAGYLEIDDDVDALHVETTASQIRRNQKVAVSSLEALERLEALRLGQVPVQLIHLGFAKKIRLRVRGLGFSVDWCWPQHVG